MSNRRHCIYKLCHRRSKDARPHSRTHTDLGLLIRLLPACCTLASLLCNCCWPPSCWRKDWMYAPSKHVNTKSSSWTSMMLSRRRLRIQWCYCLRGPFYTVGRNFLKIDATARRPRFVRRKPWQNVKNVSDLITTWGTPSERNGPGGNVLASVVDRGQNRSAPLSLRDSPATPPPLPVTDTAIDSEET